MKHIVTTLLCSLILLQSFSQAQRKVSAYLLAQYTHTLYDYTLGNNPMGAGLQLQTYFNTQSKWRPMVDLSGDTYLEDDDVYRANPDGTFPKDDNSVRSMFNLFAGALFQPARQVYVSFAAGPSFIGGHTYFGTKPSLGVYFSKNQRWTVNLSYINIYNRTKVVNQDFGSLSFAIGLKLF